MSNKKRPSTFITNDLDEEMGLEEFVENMGAFASDGNLNFIAQHYERFSNERAESLKLQHMFETNLERALNVCMEEKRIPSLLDFFANPAVPYRIKEKADRFMVGVVEGHVAVGDSESILNLLIKCPLPAKACLCAVNFLISAKRHDLLLSALQNGHLTEEARTRAQRAYSRHERWDDSTLVKLFRRKREKGNKKEETPPKPAFRRRHGKRPGPPSPITPPPNQRYTSDVPTGPMRQSQIPPLKK